MNFDSSRDLCDKLYCESDIYTLVFEFQSDFSPFFCFVFH